MELIDHDQWPDDGRDGSGAAYAAFTEPLYFPRTEGLAFCDRLWVDRKSEIDRGRAALIRANVQCPLPPNTATSEIITRFERDWPAVEAFLGTFKATTLGEELQLRVEREQFARFVLSVVTREIPPKDLAPFWNRLTAPMIAVDRENTARMKSLLRRRDWFDDAVDGPNTQTNAWLLIQHADRDPPFQRRMLRRLANYLDAGRIKREDYALLWDRVAVKDKRPQRFGSQIKCEKGELVAIGGVEDPKNLDARRAAYGLISSEAYHAVMVDLWGKSCGPEAEPTSAHMRGKSNRVRERWRSH